jgi:hypothetical protein
LRISAPLGLPLAARRESYLVDLVQRDVGPDQHALRVVVIESDSVFQVADNEFHDQTDNV